MRVVSTSPPPLVQILLAEIPLLLLKLLMGSLSRVLCAQLEKQIRVYEHDSVPREKCASRLRRFIKSRHIGARLFP